jgi:hypothetical protein
MGNFQSRKFLAALYLAPVYMIPRYERGNRGTCGINTFGFSMHRWLPPRSQSPSPFVVSFSLAAGL